MTVNLLNMLKNLLGMYEYENIEVLVLEAVANGMDAGADTININLERDSNGCYVTFHNNGVPMNETDFVNYHTVAVSTKEKGKRHRICRRRRQNLHGCLAGCRNHHHYRQRRQCVRFKNVAGKTRKWEG